MCRGERGSSSTPHCDAAAPDRLVNAIWAGVVGTIVLDVSALGFASAIHADAFVVALPMAQLLYLLPAALVCTLFGLNKVVKGIAWGVVIGVIVWVASCVAVLQGLRNLG